MPENPRSSGTAPETELGQDGRGPEHQASSRRAGPGGTPRDTEVSLFMARCLHQPWVPTAPWSQLRSSISDT